MIKTIFLVIITLSLSLAGCSQNAGGSEKEASSAQVTKIERVDSEKFESMLNKHSDAQLIDVRTAQEYKSGHLANALNIDYFDPSFKNKINELKKDQPVFVYCAVGGRSAKAAQVLKDEGFVTVVDLEGGITDWKKNGKNVKQD